MHKRIILFSFFLLCSTSIASEGEKTDEAVAAVVGKEKILRSDHKKAIEKVKESLKGKTLTDEEEKKLYFDTLQELVMVSMIHQVALSSGAANNPEFKKQLDTIKKGALVKFFLQQSQSNMAKDVKKEEIEKKSDELKGKGNQMKVLQMVVLGKESAERIVKALKNGKDFRDLAEKYSIEKSSVDRGLVLDSSVPPEIAKMSVKEVKMEQIDPKTDAYVILQIASKEPASDKNLLMQTAYQDILKDKFAKFFMNEIKSKIDVKLFDSDGKEIDKSKFESNSPFGK